jgi:transcriptional regulator with XRE-family HTH domain
MNKNTSSKHIVILGEQMERNRLLQNIPQTELARKAGISARTLRRLESGEGGSMDSFIRVLMALNIDSNLSVLIPDSTVRPMERTRPAKTERVRASRSKKLPDKATSVATMNNKKSKAKPQTRETSSWVWGDEES